jgi:hypothetical protein
MNREHLSEAERLAMSLMVSHGTMKELLMLRNVPSALRDIYLDQQAQIPRGGLAAVAICVFFLYDKCSKAGLIDSASVEAAFLADLRTTIKQAAKEGMECHSPEGALQEMYAIMEMVCRDLESKKPAMPGVNEVIEKARRQ